MSEHEQVPPPTPDLPQAPGGPPPAAGWQPGGPSGPRASFGRRLVAYLIDAVLIGIVVLILNAFLDDDVAGLIGILVGVAYFAYFEGGPRGQTLGKSALGIRVVDFNTGGAIGYGRGVLRYVGRILSGLVCLLGYFWMLWDREKQCWHDKIATTVVVPVQYYPVS
jgi:uncharacterized RDD family membrane protein YckC